MFGFTLLNTTNHAMVPFFLNFPMNNPGLDVERLRINHVVSAEQFTINSIPQNRFVDVDKLNHSIASQLDADAKHEDEKSQRNIFLSGAILLGGFLTIFTHFFGSVPRIDMDFLAFLKFVGVFAGAVDYT
jgi:hypothetical protein